MLKVKIFNHGGMTTDFWIFIPKIKKPVSSICVFSNEAPRILAWIIKNRARFYNKYSANQRSANAI